MWPLNCIFLLSSIFSFNNNKFFITEHVNLTKSLNIDILTPKFFLYLSISLTYFLADKIICVSKGVENDIKNYSFFNIEKKLTTIHNPIINDLPEIKLNDNRIIQILNVATLKKQKDHKTLIKAVSLLKDKNNYHLHIVGDGPLMNDLQNYSKKLNIDNIITFHGMIVNPSSFYEKCDIFVLSSIYEGFGNVIVEALSYGMKVISTNCNSGPNEILKDGKFGLLIPISNPIALSQAITKITKLNYNKKKLQTRSMDFNIKKICAQYESLILS